MGKLKAQLDRNGVVIDEKGITLDNKSFQWENHSFRYTYHCFPLVFIESHLFPDIPKDLSLIQKAFH